MTGIAAGKTVRAAVARENRPLTSVRGFAAMWVVFHHWLAGGPAWAEAAFGPGYTAVDLFFILSGLILTTVYRDLRLAGVPRFFVRRAMRLYPLHLATFAALILIVTCPDWSLAAAGSVRWQGPLSAALLIHPLLNITPLSNPPTWSIGVELVCYAAFPFVLPLLRLTAPRAVSLALVPALCIAEFEALWHFGDATGGWGAVARGMAGFGLGMALCRLASELTLPAAVATLGESIGLGGIVAAIWVREPSLIPLFAALLLFSLSFDSGLIARALRPRVCLWLGYISFSIYLVHYPLIVAADRWLPANVVPGGAPVRWALLVAALLAISGATYRLIEVPGRRLFHGGASRPAPTNGYPIFLTGN